MTAAVFSLPQGLPWAGRDRTLGELITFGDALWRFGGYFLVDRSEAPGCSTCENVLWVRHIGQSEHGDHHHGGAE